MRQQFSRNLSPSQLNYDLSSQGLPSKMNNIYYLFYLSLAPTLTGILTQIGWLLAPTSYGHLCAWLWIWFEGHLTVPFGTRRKGTFLDLLHRLRIILLFLWLCGTLRIASSLSYSLDHFSPPWHQWLKIYLRIWTPCTPQLYFMWECLSCQSTWSLTLRVPLFFRVMFLEYSSFSICPRKMNKPNWNRWEKWVEMPSQRSQWI